MDIARQRREIGDLAHMIFSVEHCLVQMGDAPALRNIKAEQIGQLCSCLPGNGVAPGAEFRKLPSVFVERKISVHHGRYANRANGCQLCAELLFQIRFQGSKAGPQAGVNGLH